MSKPAGHSQAVAGASVGGTMTLELTQPPAPVPLLATLPAGHPPDLGATVTFLHLPSSNTYDGGQLAHLAPSTMVDPFGHDIVLALNSSNVPKAV